MSESGARATYLRNVERRAGLAGDEETRDQRLAERGERFKSFLEGKPVEGLWARDLYPLLENLYARAHAAMMATSDQVVRAEMIGAQHMIEDLITILGGTPALGAAAIRRIAERRFGRENLLPRRPGAAT